MKSNWWYEATLEQRYRQVSEGARLGLTIDQVAKNCRVKPVVIKFFAIENNIKFEEIKIRKRDDDTFALVSMSESAATFGPPTEVSNFDPSFDFSLDIIEIIGDVVENIAETWD